MAKEPGFWSAEGFPYPLLALGQTFPRGYQYQSQMTPYARDARGDWGRALNESIDQFIGMYPQYLQQRRAFALQRDQLARQKAEDQHRAKLRPFELKQAEANQQILQQKMLMREKYPETVKGLPISEEMKAHLLTMSPEAGGKVIAAHLGKMMNRTKMIPAGAPDSQGVVRRLNVQEKPDGTIIKAAVSPEKINVFHNQLFPGTDIKNTSGVTISIDPSDNSLSYPLQKPPTQDFITVEDKGTFPDGTVNNSGRPQLYDLRSKKKVAYEGTTRKRNIVPIKKDNPLIANLQATLGNETVEKLLPFLKEDRTYANEGEPGEVIFPKGFEEITKELQQREIAKTAQTPSQLFQTKHAENNYANVGALGDLAEVAGNNLTSQRVAAVQILPEGHVVRQRAQYDLKQAGVKMGPNGIFEPEPFKPSQLRQKPRTTASAPKSTPVNQGDTLDQIVEKFKKQNITVNKSQVIAANKYFFPEGDENKMKTSAQVGGAEMLIPVGGGSLSESQVNAAHRSNDPRHNRTVIPGVGSYTNFNIATVGTAIKLNTDLADMKKLQTNVDELIGIMKRPEAIGLMKIGHPARGLIEGLRWRLVNNVQRLRDFGVLTPGEIEVIEESVPNRNSFFNMVAGKLGLRPERFIKGALRALQAEGRTKANELRALMNQYQIKETSFEIYQYDPFAGSPGEVQDQSSASKTFVDSFRD